MLPFVLRRAVLSIPLLVGITFISFLVISLAPGGPLDFLTPEDPNASPEVRQRLIKEFGLDQPVYVQYWRWLTRVVQLDFGRTFLPDGKPVLTKIGERLPITLFLNVVEMAIILGLAVPIGILSATRQHSLYDKVTTIFVFVGFATPDFWLALLLMFLFGVQLGWLPISGLRSLNWEYLPFWRQQWDFIGHLILPISVATFGGLAGFSRYMRQSMLEVIRQDYIQTARAKGLSEGTIIGKHALRNALLPDRDSPWTVVAEPHRRERHHRIHLRDSRHGAADGPVRLLARLSCRHGQPRDRVVLDARRQPHCGRCVRAGRPEDPPGRAPATLANGATQTIER